MTADASSEQIDELIERTTQASSYQECQDALHELLEIYKEDGDAEKAPDIRQAYLQALDEWPDLLQQEEFVYFLIHNVEPSDFAELQWQDPEQVIAIYEGIHSIPFKTEEIAKQATTHVRYFLRHVLRGFEEQGRLEELFQLLQLMPTVVTRDPELRRLRNRAVLYERHNVHRKRHILHAYLILHVLLVTVVFPWLFIWAENGALQDQIEELTQAEIQQRNVQFFSYSDGLYWSVITAAAIGYGDITPKTTIGRMIASVLGVLGVITIGVIAGLLLHWITPRQLE